MSIKNYFKNQFRLRSFLLQHDVASDFYLCCFLRNQSTTPLLIIRTIIFVGCLSIWISSMVLMTEIMPTKYWGLYLTHWGLVLNTIAAGSGLLVSFMASIKLPTDTNSRGPWYVQVYWVTFTIATNIAFFITIFYWALLFELAQEFAFDLTLDIFIHGVNSILMFGLLISSRQPSFFLHFYIPIGMAILYLIFTYIYFVSGGTDAFGLHTIYPMIDWENPGVTVAISALCALGIVILQGVIVAITAFRDIVTRRFRQDITTYNVYKA